MIQTNSEFGGHGDDLPVKRSIQVWRAATPQAELWVVIACGDMMIETLNPDAPYKDDKSAIERGHYESIKYCLPFDGKILNCE